MRTATAVSDASEVSTLAEAGIESIDLVSDGVGYSAAAGEVTVHGEAEFTTTNGEIGVIGDVELAAMVSSEDVDVAELGHNINGQPKTRRPQTVAAESLTTSPASAPAMIPARPRLNSSRSSAVDFDLNRLSLRPRFRCI